MLRPKDLKCFIIGVIATLMLLICNVCCSCNQAEYKTGGECCPMCQPGSRVYRHCTAQSSTSCVPCVGSTFTDEPNGLIECKLCAVCDQGLGLKTVTACTPSSDTVCGVLEGHYCINPYKGGCRAANKHTACKPGQFIQQPGTEYINTVCEDCSDNSYSNGSFTSCKPHTDCQSNVFLTIKAGGRSFDSECSGTNRITTGIINNWKNILIFLFLFLNNFLL
ncbi:tumor necrosis factor receptor superfamily member 14-like [Brienomyrus brachyistius]|uniref:tumor necrosis factor receptor superfamily member 14-like n=1 Tax=Brienomyrus brachyistius TaxID=42636 RepID=UPI0020B2E8E8|nr:tumor necrosis factor receptor superfamily member 14-like [Brienomyrus brachyistius]